jgi:Asp-tRNA(Asn)/Glu-tRNA(Gln) amidotransferase A subunit family amidase
MPFGLQIVGRQFGDDLVLEAAAIADKVVFAQ